MKAQRVAEPAIVKRLKYRALSDATPQAIFWRKIQCFALNPDKDQDELDVFLFASFTIGNQVTFDLRHYDGHPDTTVTVYLPTSTVEDDEIDSAIDQVISSLRMPQSGVAWRRGEDFEFGQLPRRAEDRLLEAEARLLALKIAAECVGLEAPTEYIKQRVPELIPLTAKDQQKSPSRPREQLWQQIVGNVISHKGSSRSIFSQGLAVRTTDGLKVTETGKSYLKRVGFLR